MSKLLNFKGPNRTHAQILTMCVCGLDQRKMAFSQGQPENTETRERKREREREGTPKTEVNIFDRAAHNKAIVF